MLLIYEGILTVPHFGKVKSTITMFISYMGLAVYGFVGLLGGRISIRSMYLVICIAVVLGLVLATLPRIGMRRMESEHKSGAVLPE
ncbi:hypothetical protein AAKU55_005847 [Oxalobacteraceae bacterium GrIS 1.11]